MRRFLHGFRSLFLQWRHDGLAAAWRWLHGHAVPCLVGVPALRFCRVTDRLLVGPQIGRAGMRLLLRHGVRASVNLRIESCDRARGVALPEHLHLPTVDDTPPALEQLAEGAAFIRRALAAGRTVYVHCASGVGRAPTLAIAFLVSEGASLDEAMGRVRQARPFVRLTGGQHEQLVRFAALARRERS
ncbi:MAG: dual specificity protein phosphatase family protein [Gemmataceae bacterium]|nr:dual specificity protein phosphatase family protein [Gemmataceae bacterium]